MEKATFLGHDKPLLVCMLQFDTPEGNIEAIRGGERDGADAYGFQLESLPKEYHNEETIRKIFAEMHGKPIYVTNYRGHGCNNGKTDDELAETLKDLVRYGATLIDVMGDYYAPCANQLTMDPEAIQKQMKLIDELHALGAEVLMSSHVLKFTPAEEVMRIALEQKKRGADFIKIVVSANSEEEETENLHIISMLKEQLGAPFLFVCNGTHHKLVRQLGPYLGCSICLVVYEHHKHSTPAQPVLKKEHALLETLDEMDIDSQPILKHERALMDKLKGMDFDFD